VKLAQPNKIEIGKTFPKLPRETFRGLIGQYCDLFRESEAPCAFHLATALTVIGIAAGRNVSANYAQRIYPNFYTVLVGPTATSRKSTAASFGQQFLAYLAPELRILTGVSTPEGLLLQIGDRTDSDGSVLTSAPALIYEDEFSKLLKKARQEYTANIIPFLNNAFNCPPKIENLTKNQPLRATNPTLSILACAPIEEIDQHMLNEDVSSGFTNRFTFFLGNREQLRPVPGVVNEGAIRELAKETKEKIGRWNAQIFRISPEANDLWKEFYQRFDQQQWSTRTIQTINQRMPLHCMKIALLYSAIENDQPLIGADQLSVAMKIVGYLMESSNCIFCDFDSVPDARLESKVLKILQEAGGALTRRQLRQTLGGRVSGKQVNMVLSAMKSNDQIACYTDNTTNRKWVCRLL